MRRTRLFLLLLFFAGRCLPLVAQSNEYLIQSFTTDNGLPSNGIKGMEWDEETGFLWIATEAGVTRYNGIDFLTFSRANTPEISSERMLFMLKNRLGRIYTADETGNIFFIIRNKLQFLGGIKLDDRNSTVRLIGLAASGKMFRQSSGQPPDHFGFNFNFAGDLAIPMSDTHIILYHRDSGTQYPSGLYDYTTGRKEPLLICPIEPGSNLFSLGGELFLFNRRKGFSRLDTVTRKQIPVPLELPVPLEKQQVFWENNMQDPILLADSRAWTLEYKDRHFIPRLICTAIPTDALLSYVTYEKKSGILFLGTNSRGIVVIRRHRVRTLKKPPPAIDQGTACYTQVPLSNGTVLTSQGDILGGRPPLSSEIPIRTSFNNFTLLTPDSILWYSRGDSMYGYSYKTKHTSVVLAGTGSITEGFVLSGGRLWLANSIGVGFLNDGKIAYVYRHPQADIFNNVPFAMQELEPGKLAIACCNGLLRFDTRTAVLDTLLHFPGVCIRGLWKYKDYLFIGTYGKGIYIWKNGILRSIPTDKNNYLQYAHCFIPDKEGFCWISTNKGLFRARPGDMTNAFEKNLPEVYYHYYGRNDGLDITELNGGCTPCALALNDSTLSFPTMDGLVAVDPTKAGIQFPIGDIYVDNLYADDKKISMSSLLMPEFPSNTRELLFRLGFPAWVNKENLYIDYKLEPWSKEWQSLEIQNNPLLRFSNLPSGNYRLVIRKLNGFGENNYSYKETRFRIVPHWYQQYWAWLLGLCCLTGLIMWIVGIRTRQFQVRENKLERQIAAKTKELKLKNEELEKTDHIKTRLISIISHDLVTPLKFLHLAGKGLIEKKNQLPEELQRETITEIMNTSKELELLSTNILNWIKYRNEDRRLAKESFNLHQLVRQLFGIFNSMAKQKQIRLINEVDEQLVLYQFIEPVKIVLYNLILNGINFTQEGHILVSSSLSPEGMILSIQDTGVGMTQDQITNIMADHFIISSANVDKRKGNGLGYLIIKDLLKIIRGSLSIQSEKGKGSRVTVRLPGSSL